MTAPKSIPQEGHHAAATSWRVPASIIGLPLGWHCRCIRGDELLKTYLESFDPRIVALTGTPEEMAAAAKAFRISYRKVPTEGGGYTMEHTASVVVTDAGSKLVSLVDYH